MTCSMVLSPEKASKKKEVLMISEPELSWIIIGTLKAETKQTNRKPTNSKAIRTICVSAVHQTTPPKSLGSQDVKNSHSCV